MRQPSRRRVLQAAGTAALAGLAGCASSDATDDLCGTEPPPKESTVRTDAIGSVPAPADDAAWSQRGHDAGRTGYTTDAAPTSDVGLGWRTTLDDEAGEVSLAVADGRLLAVSEEAGTLTALDPADGTVDWTVTSLTEPSGPAVAEGLVVVPDEAGLHAFALGDGSERWTFAPAYETPTPDEGSDDGEGEASTVAGTLTPGGTGDDEAGTTADGEQGDTGDGTGGRAAFYEPPIHAAGTFLAKGDGGVYAVAPDGRERWRLSQARFGVVSDGLAYLQADGVVAVDVATGSVERRLERVPGDAFAARDGVLYGGSLRDFGAVDAASGDDVWSFEGEWESFQSPAVTPDSVYVTTLPTEGDDGNNLYAFDRDSGEPRWCQYYGHRYLRPVAATSEGVVVPTEDALEVRAPSDGSLRWRFGRPSDRHVTFRSPVVVDGVCYVGTDRSTVLAFAER